MYHDNLQWLHHIDTPHQAAASWTSKYRINGFQPRDYKQHAHDDKNATHFHSFQSCKFYLRQRQRSGRIVWL